MKCRAVIVESNVKHETMRSPAGQSVHTLDRTVFLFYLLGIFDAGVGLTDDTGYSNLGC